jgi:hypothetical protein
MKLYAKLLPLFLIPAALVASDSKAARQSLKGLTGFAVMVEDVGSKKTAGVDPAKIKANVEAKLKTAGIKILSEDEAAKAPGNQRLNINLDSITGKDGTVSFELTLEVLQACSLARDPNMKFTACNTWSRGKVGRANSGIPAFIDQQIASEVDAFLRAYAEVNPRK